MKRLWGILVIALALGPLRSGPQLAKFEPDGGCYLGAFIEHDALARGDVALFEQIVGRKHACYINYTGYGRPFPAAWAGKIAAQGGALHLAMEPNKGLGQVRDDEYLRTWARCARDAGLPIFLRFASEMNGNWMIYSGNPSLYVEKWRIIAKVMREEAPNVALVWCPFYEPLNNLSRYYPGDDWVDWVGVNIYSVFYHNNDPGQPAAGEDPRALLEGVYNLYAARKPIMICEYAASHRCRVMGGQTSKFAIEKMTTLYESLPKRFPRVKCIQWFSWDTIIANSADNDYSLTANPSVTAAYKRLTAGSYFLGSVGAPRTRPTTPSINPPTITLPPLGPKPAPQPGPPLVGPVLPGPPDKGPTRVSALPTEGSLDDDPDALRPLRSPIGLLGLRPGQRVTSRLSLSAYYPADWNVHFVLVQVNGRTIYAGNRQPFSFDWDPSGLEPGRYEVRAKFLRDGFDPVYSPVVDVEVRRP